MKQYKSIQLNTLFVDELLGFDIYLKHGHNYTLYKNNTASFNNNDKQRLERNGVEKLFIKNTESTELNKYLESNLKNCVLDESIPKEKRSEILFTTSTNFLDEIYTNSFSIGKEDRVQRSYDLVQNILHLSLNMEEVLSYMTKLVDHNYYEYSHGIHMASLAIPFAEFCFDLAKDELIDIGIGSIMHDIGKTQISNSIIAKPGKLSDNEYKVIKNHPVLGYEMLRDYYSITILNMVKHHHERHDGSGYPNQLTDKNITRNAKIAIIIDVFCALIVDRSYRVAMTKRDAIQLMKDQMLNHFDPYLFDKFQEMIKIYFPEDFC